MEIDKQLFEDVLAGKLKGVFVLRNGNKISHKTLHRTTSDIYPYSVSEGDTLGFYCHIPDATQFSTDIVKFIPDIDMKENELTIEIPNDKVVDWDESKKQNRIVLKDKQLTYKDICEKLFKNKEFFFTNNTGIIESSSPVSEEYLINAVNNSTSYHQLECILAKNMLANTAKYLNDGWKPDKNDTGNFDAWVLYLTPDKNYIGYVKISSCEDNSNILFKSYKLAKQAIEILGEKIIKLALTPLGI